MNRTDLGERLGQRLEIPRAAAVALLDAVFDEVAEATCRGEVVRVHRFGRFVPQVRAGGTRPNPRGGTMSFPERVSVSFLPGRYYKERLNQEEPAA